MAIQMFDLLAGEQTTSVDMSHLICEWLINDDLLAKGPLSHHDLL